MSPLAPMRPCKHCGAGTREQPCGDCAAQGKGARQPDLRASAAARGYNRRWRRFRLSVLAARPMCEQCQHEGRGPIAGTTLHHRVPLKERPDLKYDAANILVVCGRCHAKIERSEGKIELPEPIVTASATYP